MNGGEIIGAAVVALGAIGTAIVKAASSIARAYKESRDDELRQQRAIADRSMEQQAEAIRAQLSVIQEIRDMRTELVRKAEEKIEVMERVDADLRKLRDVAVPSPRKGKP